MIRKSIASILIILILINSIGCYSYNQIEIGNTKEFEKDDEVKITTLDEKVYYLYDVEIQGSILKGYGYKYISWGYQNKSEEIVIPTQQIKKIEVDKFNPAITVLTVVLIIGIPLAAFAIAMANADYH